MFNPQLFRIHFIEGKVLPQILFVSAMYNFQMKPQLLSHITQNLTILFHEKMKVLKPLKVNTDDLKHD